MSIAMKYVEIDPDLLKAISKIAKDRHTNENEIINEIISNGIMGIEDEIDIAIIAKEFGQTKEELIKELEDANARINAGKGIELDVDNLDEMFKS